MGSRVPPPDWWATASGQQDGLPVIYRYRQNRPNAADYRDYPHALRVRWSYDRQRRSGLPPADVNDAQRDFEAAIEPLGDCAAGYLMLVLTGNGRKEWIYYIRDLDAWLDQFNACLEDHEPYPIVLDDWPDPDWSTWQRFTDSVLASQGPGRQPSAATL